MYLRKLSLFLFISSIFMQGVFSQSTFDGYTFVFSGKKAYLYDMDKKVIKTWTVQNNIEGCADLLRDSSIIVPTKASGGFAGLALPHGHFQIINWNGEITWDYTYASSSYMPHHDIEPVYRTNDPKEKPTFLIPCYTEWGDKIVELRPTGKTTAEVIWEWNASDHTCESNCKDKSDLLDKSKGGVGCFNKTSDAMHVNNVSYNRTLDQLILSCKGYNEMIVIDHSTTTAQAKTSSGGKYGKGGSILYRWGCPANYGAGTAKSVLKGQHHCCWVQDTMIGTNLPIPGGGNFMSIDNGNKRGIEILNPFKNGIYSREANQAFEPATILWSYSPSGLASNEGSIQRLPNGNYLICTGGFNSGFSGGGSSKIYEVTPSGTSGTIVWELGNFGTSTEGYRYAYSYLTGASTPAKKSVSSLVKNKSITTISNRYNGRVHISVNGENKFNHLSLFSLSGRELIKTADAISQSSWDLGAIPDGIYFVKFFLEEKVIFEKISVH